VESSNNERTILGNIWFTLLEMYDWFLLILLSSIFQRFRKWCVSSFR